MKEKNHVTKICISAMLLSAIAVPCSAQTPTPAASPSLQGLDYLALIGYRLVIVGIGIYFSRREGSTDDYFLAGPRIPWWAEFLGGPHR